MQGVAGGMSYFGRAFLTLNDIHITQHTYFCIEWLQR